MTGRQQVILGGLLGLVGIALWLSWTPDLFNVSPLSATDRLALGIRCAVVIQLPLIAGILVVSQQRFWSTGHADGSSPVDGSALDINRRYLTNTLEQTVLATVGLLALSITAPAANLGFVPALASLFLIGRICFWVAYHINPYARAFGLVLTLVPTTGVYIYLLLTFAGQG